MSVLLTNLYKYTHYDPMTGSFVYIQSTANRIKIGQSLGTRTTTGSRRVRFFGKTYEVPRLIWYYMTQEWPTGVIDHIDGNKLNNKWTNLRDVSQQVNLSNKHVPQTNNRLGILGVDKINSKYRARIKIDGKQKYLGLYNSAEEAHNAYLFERQKFAPIEGIKNHNHRTQ